MAHTFKAGDRVWTVYGGLAVSVEIDLSDFRRLRTAAESDRSLFQEWRVSQVTPSPTNDPACSWVQTTSADGSSQNWRAHQVFSTPEEAVAAVEKRLKKLEDAIALARVGLADFLSDTQEETENVS